MSATTRAGVRLEAIAYVRGGLDPNLATPGARDRVVRNLCALDRPDLAGVFLAGWVTHRPCLLLP